MGGSRNKHTEKSVKAKQIFHARQQKANVKYRATTALDTSISAISSSNKSKPAQQRAQRVIKNMPEPAPTQAPSPPPALQEIETKNPTHKHDMHVGDGDGWTEVSHGKRKTSNKSDSVSKNSKTSSPPKLKYCLYFLQDRCKHGDDCRNSHQKPGSKDSRQQQHSSPKAFASTCTNSNVQSTAGSVPKPPTASSRSWM